MLAVSNAIPFDKIVFNLFCVDSLYSILYTLFYTLSDDSL